MQRIVRAFTDEAGVPGQWLEWHGHNDFHKVLVNGVTAWLYGCGAVNGTLFGFGERTGNTPWKPCWWNISPSPATTLRRTPRF